MNLQFPVYTIANECHDCYKCVRSCPAKAIRVVNGRASVMPERCVCCGICVRVCPAEAKQIRNDVTAVRFLLAQPGHKVFVSLAPSWINFFKNITPGQMAEALRRLGFAGVSETALGAQLVSARIAEVLDAESAGIHISSCCPAAVEYIAKYLPEFADAVTPVLSPALTHARMLKEHFGSDSTIVFVGPCAAKKIEAARHPELLSHALTFDNLARVLEQEKIDPAALPADAPGFVPEAAEEGALYPIEGGMIETIRPNQPSGVHFLTLSGLRNIDRVLRGERARLPGDAKVFIECLACPGGCVNGPGMSCSEGKLSELLEVAALPQRRSSLGRPVNLNLNDRCESAPVAPPPVSDEAINAALAAIGKYSRADELNCGGCGYSSCRELARALVEGKAEAAMCVSHLRRLTQKKSTALIRYIPAGVVIVDRDLAIIECNEKFAAMIDEDTRIAFEAMPGLAGVDLRNVIDRKPILTLFEAALSSGEDIERSNFMAGDRIMNITVFSIEPHRIVGAIMQDVTESELDREKIAENARAVIKKNILTVQKIANYLGEHMAETEILLREVASKYKREDGEK